MVLPRSKAKQILKRSENGASSVSAVLQRTEADSARGHAGVSAVLALRLCGRSLKGGNLFAHSPAERKERVSFSRGDRRSCSTNILASLRPCMSCSRLAQWGISHIMSVKQS